MFKTEMQKILDSSEKKIVFMKESPLSYIVLAALAGIYLGFGIVLIFSITGPIAAAGGGAARLCGVGRREEAHRCRAATARADAEGRREQHR